MGESALSSKSVMKNVASSGQGLVAILLLVFVASTSASLELASSKDHAFNITCMNKLMAHIEREFQASVTYMAMGAWANQYNNQRPGFAKMFFESAKEERDHGLTMLNYLKVINGDMAPKDGRYEWETPLAALRQALDMEKQVTQFIKEIIDECADAEDHHLADYLTGEFMEEQLQGQRKLAGHINSLSKLMGSTKGAKQLLATYLYDQKLNRK